jgi:hypothetical protein
MTTEDQRHMLDLARKLADRLAPEGNVQPELECDCWLIHWRPNRVDRLFVGAVVKVQEDYIVRLLTDGELDKLAYALTPIQRAQIDTLLNAVYARLRSRNVEPPRGISYTPTLTRPQGDSPEHILDSLWPSCAEKMLRPSSSADGKQEKKHKHRT